MSEGAAVGVEAGLALAKVLEALATKVGQMKGTAASTGEVPRMAAPRAPAYRDICAD